jgi:aminoglycoside phosphotransferase (APT) family kinase protein
VRSEASISVDDIVQNVRARTVTLRTAKCVNIAFALLDRARANLGDKVTSRLALGHGDFLPANFLWDSSGQLFVIDFEHAGHRDVCHDLLTMVFSLRLQLLNPLVSLGMISSLENSFWKGYGPVSHEIRSLVDAVASARILYHSLPWIASRKLRRGKVAGVSASIYKVLFEKLVIARCLEMSGSDLAIGS